MECPQYIIKLQTYKFLIFTNLKVAFEKEQTKAEITKKINLHGIS